MLKGKLMEGIRKPLLFLLCALFVLGSMPAAAFAEEGQAEAGGEVSTEAEAPAQEEEAEDGDDPILTNRLKDWPQAKAKISDYVCLLDTSTNTVLINKAMDVQSPPASLTKIMTTLLALEKGNLDDPVTMTETGVEYAVGGSSNLYTVVGETFTLRDMLYGVMLASANDMATQVAEYIGGGSVANFVDMMNERAKELGCTGTNFVNACGMPAEGHVSTAHDMALISKEALKNDTFREIVSTVNYTIAASQIYAPREITNHHPCLADPEHYGWEGVFGGKTGYTDAAGSCLATYCEKDGRLMVCITMHGPTQEASLDDTDMAFQYGYTKWKLREVKPGKGEKLVMGGQVLTPKKKSVDDCETKVTVKDVEDGKENVKTVYYWGGEKVGYAVMRRKKAVESVPEVSDEAAVAAAAASGASGAADASEEASSSVPIEVGIEIAASIPEADTAAAADAEAVTKDTKSTTPLAAQMVVLPIGNITMNRASFISISILALLILLGIILILLTIALKR